VRPLLLILALPEKIEVSKIFEAYQGTHTNRPPINYQNNFLEDF
jgi:hypothetical protein